MYTYTEQQTEIMEAFRTMMEAFDRKNRKLVIQARAGTGKTFILARLGEIANEFGKKGKFMSFNKAIVVEAGTKMPPNVACTTFHAYFYGSVGQFYKHRSNKVSASRTAEILGITEDLELSEKTLTPVMQARLIYRAVGKYSMSDDWEISGWHIPYIRGLTDEDMETVRATLTPYLKRAWQDIADKKGVLRFKPENYIKIGALANPKIAASFVFVDEAQDTFPVVLGWLRRQPHIRLVVTGDSAQAINEWTGAVDSMNKWESIDRETLESKDDVVYKTLSMSFRFSPELADEANRPLSLLGGYIDGDPSKQTTVAEVNDGIPDVILCRTNAGVINAAMNSVAQGIKTATSKRNMEDIQAIGQAALQLMAGTSCDLEDFAAFQSWEEVLEYVENDPGGSDIKTIVTLIEKYGPTALLNLSSSLVPQEMAQTVILTVHTSKGLEFPVVEIYDDFPEPLPTKDGEPGEVSAELARLIYVAMTRAQEYLNWYGVSWIKNYIKYEDEVDEDE